MTKHAYLTIAAALGAASALGLAGCGSSGTRPATTGTKAATPAVLASTVAPGRNGTITTTGVGNVNGQSDTLTLGIGVTTTAPHAAESLSENNAVATRVQQTLERDGVVKADLQTTGLSLQPAYPAGTGYQVYDEVTATVTDLTRAGTMIDDALRAAGDDGRLDMATLSLSSTNPYLASARSQAVNAARVDASELAAAAGERLGTLVSITDTSQQSGTPYPDTEFTAAAASSSVAAPVPIQAGTQQVTVSVTAVWSLVAETPEP
jgi:uncharacterized protein